MPSRYLEQNTLYISDKKAINILHSLFEKNEKTELPISRYTKSKKEVIEFIKG